jgi:hypothetical protein
MSTETFWAEIEAEQAWREAEIRFLQNQLALLEEEEARDRFRRTLIVMLYSHLEGFCKFAFGLYVRGINEAQIKCAEATFAIAAASLADLFDALRDSGKKCEEFRNQLPSDEKLHRFARDREFLERAQEFDARIVEIPESVIDLEANLKPVVLRKALYRLGLAHDQFAVMEGQIHMLLNYRNKIAHGAFRDGVPKDTYQVLYGAVFDIMAGVKRDIMAALDERRYLRAS